jgi:hypothetical protein
VSIRISFCLPLPVSLKLRKAPPPACRPFSSGVLLPELRGSEIGKDLVDFFDTNAEAVHIENHDLIARVASNRPAAKP